MQRHLFVLFLLALTQITGWGVVSVLPVIAATVAAEFQTLLPTVFIGTSVMFVAMGLAAPWIGRAFRRFGPRSVMAAGAGVIAVGLCLLALSTGLLVFWAAWVLIGLAGSMFLTTSAYAYIADYAEDRARSLIGTLMLVTGLAGSVFWPITALLDGVVGWRATVLIYAGIMAFVVCPLVLLGLPATGTGAPEAINKRTARKGPVFALLVTAIALNSFVTFGIEAVGIQLLQATGMDLARAIAVASLLGVFKVGGRVIDLLGGNRWDGLSTGIVSGAMIPIGLAVMWIGGQGILSVAGFLVIYGVGSGAFAVARATMPLVFFEKSDYAAAMATIALPMNLINALAPPVLAALMAGTGAHAVFAVLGALSTMAFIVLWQLNRKRSWSAIAG
ncbi:MFS transporter [Rhizobium sp. NFACC06-2]|uniref:MFS transporter n=1 Tax=Rhizobium sp. NFACC06-2 TaxID=1566264 RepID=UPI00087748E1|nr:MFS transporter [Rhizobium sp. NFACC06-2]SCY69105.1 Predicted arabinose efflux permease, MFS family [Rhizobium sp. NFACC06-2]